jgi:flavin reductase (DIM6/NTAB) family NADH-FMN oxidoreductase RutF
MSMAFADALSIADAGARSDVVSPHDFREAMRELAAGVTLVTSVFEGARAGCVVSSLTSLSLTPPSMLVCLNTDSSTLRCIRASGVFAVNMLKPSHASLVRRFSGIGIRGPDRFAEGEWRRLATGAPTLIDALTVVDCRLERIVEYATHAILIGAAAAVAKSDEGGALLHWRSRFEAIE